MPTVIADTGPLFATSMPRDEHHAAARSALGQLAAARGEVVVLTPTACEAYSLVLQRSGVAFAHRWYHALVETAVIVTPTHEDFLAAFPLIERYRDQDVSLFDALIAVVSNRTNAPIWTYDHHFDVLRANVWRGETA